MTVKAWVLNRRKWLILLGCIPVVMTSAFVFRAPILTSAAEVWIVQGDLDKADAILVLGGGNQTRPFEAARLYHEGYAPKILLTDIEHLPTDKLGLSLSETEWEKRTLLKKGVPATAIEVIGHQVSSTYDEALVTKRWIEANHAKRILIPTDPFHTRRVEWLVRKVSKGTGVVIDVQPVPALNYKADNWWLHEEGLINFQNEVVKYVFYRLKY